MLSSHKLSLGTQIHHLRTGAPRPGSCCGPLHQGHSHTVHSYPHMHSHTHIHSHTVLYYTVTHAYTVTHTIHRVTHMWRPRAGRIRKAQSGPKLPPSLPTWRRPPLTVLPTTSEPRSSCPATQRWKGSGASLGGWCLEDNVVVEQQGRRMYDECKVFVCVYVCVWRGVVQDV